MIQKKKSLIKSRTIIRIVFHNDVRTFIRLFEDRLIFIRTQVKRTTLSSCFIYKHQ